jgi:SAM-dependent methyltransferase
MEANTYARSADLYDLDPAIIHAADIGFFVERASRTAGPVLELGCGTGRITLPLAKAGVDVRGLDLSEGMLAILRRKLALLPSEEAARIQVQLGNMASFSLAERFGLVIIPFRSFQALVTKEEQQSCLRCVREHMKDDGRFIINVFRPFGRLDKSWEAPPRVDWEVMDPASGKKVTRKHARRHINVENQILEIDLIFSIEGGEEFIDPLKLSYFYPDQMEALLREAGFTIVESMGDYDGRPLGEGGELIYVCRKSG